jgi:parvulin-like peptidyl-prolyl isomerase
VARKKTSKQAQQAASPMTRRQLSRWQAEKRQERLALLFVIGTIALVAFILSYGAWTEVIGRPRQVVARVGSTNITLQQVADVMKYQAKTLDEQINLTNSQVAQAQVQAQSDPNSSFLYQYLQQQLQQLQLERLQLNNGQTPMEDLIEQTIIKQELARDNVTVTSADIDQAIQEQFQPQAPAPSEPVTDTTTVTVTGPITNTPVLTPTPSPTPIPADAWQARYQDTLTTYNITDAEFRRFTMQPLVERQKLQDIIGATVPTTTEMVHASQIQVATIADAQDIITLLNASPSADFADFAKKRSIDDATKDNGGDLGWFPRGEHDPIFDDAVFALDPGQISGVISTTTSIYVVKVWEKDPNHPLDQTRLDQAKTTAFNNWLDQQKQSSDIQRYLDAAKQDWLNKQIPAAS